jgi:hypothetical protein
MIRSLLCITSVRRHSELAEKQNINNIEDKEFNSDKQKILAHAQ